MKKIALSIAAGTAAFAATPAMADQVIADDLIVQGSTCVGLDCVNNENFGFNTIILKENNTRILFDDTSNTGSFPANDFSIVINDSANGGLSYFEIRDVTSDTALLRLCAVNDANCTDIFPAGLGGPDPQTATNTTAIAANTTAIAANTSAIAANTTAIDLLDNRVDRLERHDRENRGGVAMALAMGATTSLTPDQHFNLGVGVGTFGGQSAVGVSGTARLSNMASINAGLGYATKKVGARVGVNFGW